MNLHLSPSTAHRSRLLPGSRARHQIESKPPQFVTPNQNPQVKGQRSGLGGTQGGTAAAYRSSGPSTVNPPRSPAGNRPAVDVSPITPHQAVHLDRRRRTAHGSLGCLHRRRDQPGQTQPPVPPKTSNSGAASLTPL